jgi:allantoate deiminase
MLIDKARDVIRLCRQLSECSEEAGRTTRTFLSPSMREVYGRLTGWMEGTGMTVSLDAAGNLRGVYPAVSEPAARLLIGSHLDTVRHAGAFDGVIGVVVGAALVELLDGRRLPFAIEVLGFSDEEGLRFGVPFIGSRALVGALDDDLLARRDPSGVTVREALVDFGLDPAALPEARTADALGYLEFHIEQGPALDDLSLPLGVVTAISGQTRLEIAFRGTASHAGTTPMPARRDALAGAAEWIGLVEAAARATRGLVATVGRLDVLPGASNVVPGLATAALDVRHADDGVRAAAVEHLVSEARAVAARRGLDVSAEIRLDQASVPMDGALTARVARAVQASGYPVHLMPSGAGHDAMIVASRLPTAMLFIRNPGGVSHHPDEDVTEEDVAAALAAGLALVDDLARHA